MFAEYYLEPHPTRQKVIVKNLRDGLLFSNQKAMGLVPNTKRFDTIAIDKYGDVRRWRIIAVRNVGNWLAGRGQCIGTTIRY